MKISHVYERFRNAVGFLGSVRCFIGLFGMLMMSRLAAADYVSSGNTTIDFPFQPPPQFAVVDVGGGDIVDMNDSGQLLLSFWSDDTYSYTHKIWTAGVTTNVTVSSGDYSYNWLSLTNNGTVLRTYYNDDISDYGFVSWTSGGGATRVSYVTAAAAHAREPLPNWSGGRPSSPAMRSIFRWPLTPLHSWAQIWTAIPLDMTIFSNDAVPQ